MEYAVNSTSTDALIVFFLLLLGFIIIILITKFSAFHVKAKEKEFYKTLKNSGSGSIVLIKQYIKTGPKRRFLTLLIFSDSSKKTEYFLLEEEFNDEAYRVEIENDKISLIQLSLEEIKEKFPHLKVA